MPNALVKKVAKEYGVSIGDVEKLWNQAKKSAIRKFKLENVPESAWEDKHWRYITGVFKIIVKNKYGPMPSGPSKKK